ncbi:unnamed protein product, partial [Rotaria sp. Silwood1]
KCTVSMHTQQPLIRVDIGRQDASDLGSAVPPLPPIRSSDRLPRDGHPLYRPAAITPFGRPPRDDHPPSPPPAITPSGCSPRNGRPPSPE